MNIIKFRELEDKDTDKIVMWRNQQNVLKYFIDRRVINNETHKKWKKEKVDTGLVAQFIVIYEDEEVGSVFIKDIDYNNKEAEFGIFIGVDTYRGRGIGKAGMKFIIDVAKNKGLKKIKLRVLSTNVTAINFYLSMDFKEIERYLNSDICELVLVMERDI